MPPDDRLHRLRTELALRRQELERATDDHAEYIVQWRARVEESLSGLLVAQRLGPLMNLETDSAFKDRKMLLKLMVDLEAAAQALPESILLPEEAEARAAGRVRRRVAPGTPPSVFVVHGHDHDALTQVADMLRRLGLPPLILHDEVNQGRTVIEKFERDAAAASYAIVLLTPDDLGHARGAPGDLRPRARQNVLLELGYFIAALGRSHVSVLLKGNVETPSDFLGVVCLEMDDPGKWRYKLAKEMRDAGLPADANLLA